MIGWASQINMSEEDYLFAIRRDDLEAAQELFVPGVPARRIWAAIRDGAGEKLALWLFGVCEHYLIATAIFELFGILVLPFSEITCKRISQYTHADAISFMVSRMQESGDVSWLLSSLCSERPFNHKRAEQAIMGVLDMGIYQEYVEFAYINHRPILLDAINKLYPQDLGKLIQVRFIESADYGGPNAPVPDDWTAREYNLEGVLGGITICSGDINEVAFMYACRHGHVDRVKQYLRLGFDMSVGFDMAFRIACRPVAEYLAGRRKNYFVGALCHYVFVDGDVDEHGAWFRLRPHLFANSKKCSFREIQDRYENGMMYL